MAQISDPIDGSWIHLINPVLEELEQIQRANIPPEFLTYPLDQDEMARTQRDEGVTLVILRVPRAIRAKPRTSPTRRCRWASSRPTAWS